MHMFRQPAYIEGVGISSRSIKIYFSILFIALIGVIGFLWWRGMLQGAT
jgi:hypothetical protein